MADFAPRAMTLNPFLSVWTQPRRTVRMITIEKPSFLVWPLAILAGINDSLHRAANSYHGHATPPPWQTVAAMAVLVGCLAGPFSVWVGAYLLRWTGRVMDGGASLRRLRTAMAWGMLPSLLSLLLWIPRLLFFGTSALTGGPLNHRGSSPDLMLLGLLGLVDLVLVVWRLVLLCNTVAEVQSFESAWQGLANLFLGGLAVAVPIIVLLFAVMAMTHRF